MKIAIVTLYAAYNYGGFLQAFAMQKTLESYGHEVAMLNCSKEKGLISIRKKIDFHHFSFSVKRYFAYKKGWKKLNIHQYNGEHYDMAILGSDEIWNLKGSFEHWPQFLGRELNADKIVAYAPSIGFCEPDYLANNNDFVTSLSSINEVLPRDEITLALCNKIDANVMGRVIDPALLYIESWDSVVPKRIINQKYVVYYSYLDNTPMKEHILKYAHANNYRVVIVGFNYSWGDELSIATPFEFLSLIKYAECVFTSTFHGTVFSTVFKKPIVVRPSGQKVVDYLSLLGLADRIFEDKMNYERFCELVEKEISYDEVRGIQISEMNNSTKLLKNALQAKN